ncbi:MAG TPA: polyribonucleotide nucleotidyltransferase [Acidobacteriota bacterium]|nr:polyribonucleotide nucleotidyltransferase [Acidobacteriota bacterium]
MVESVSLTLGGSELNIEMGKLAKQANGAALVSYGDTRVLVTAVSEREPKENATFFPLTCDYREYTSAVGRFPGGFFKREGRPSEKETLTSRLIDRPIRPLFPDGYAHETQVIAFVLSAEEDVNPDTLALVGASAALYASDIPFHRPIGCVRIGLIDGQFVVNPNYSQLEESRLNLVVAGTDDAIVMVEAGAEEISEQEMADALEYAHEEIKRIVAVIRELQAKRGIPKREYNPPQRNQEVYDKVSSMIGDRLKQAMNTKGKAAQDDAVRACKEEVVEAAGEDEELAEAHADAFSRLKENLFRRQLLEEKRRTDGRANDEIRSIWTEVGALPRTHGSAIFTRGETQALCTVTLGTEDDAQRTDGLAGEDSKKFMLHYNFPPFSVGEARFLRGPGRREIGHGALAERALRPTMPNAEDFPYTIRVISDILESNGSSSMATVCGGCLALMDAGVPVSSAVAGVAMGLVKEGDNYIVLSDIAGFEDHYGDMDFKVAGTRQGLTALQMDIKITGVTKAIMSEALEQARRGRLHILDKMAESITEPRQDISAYAPRIVTITIPTDKIGEVIGPGGKQIRSIIDQTGVKIDIEDDGTVRIASVDGESAQKAIKIIEEITASAEVGRTYMGKVVKVVDFGAFVEILPGTDGLLHISEIAERHVKDIREEIRVGDKIMVKVLDVDPSGKIRLSRKAVLRDQRGERRNKGR